MTDIYPQRLQVKLDYDVIFTHRSLEPSNSALADVLKTRSCRKILVFLDSGLVDAWPDLPSWFESYLAAHRFELAAPPLVLPGGEPVKNGSEHTSAALDEMRNHHLCRHSVVIAAGGGALLDVVGFAASLIHRGVRLVRYPTTTLSQGDSGVGVKNGINLRGVKNVLGTFAPPFAVLNDLDFLSTLTSELVLDGIAEAFKVAIIKDRDFFEFLVQSAESLGDGESPAVHEAVKRAALLHMDHIAKGGDPFELGNARPLDFGHWSAHWLEAATKNDVRHGQAVAIGIALDSHIASSLGYLSAEDRDVILDTFQRGGLPIWHPFLASRDDDGRLGLLEGLAEFREHLGGSLSITLPKGLGNRVEITEVPSDVIERGLEFLEQRATK